LKARKRGNKWENEGRVRLRRDKEKKKKNKRLDVMTGSKRLTLV
jgi:hypothetical protein